MASSGLGNTSGPRISHLTICSDQIPHTVKSRTLCQWSQRWGIGEFYPQTSALHDTLVPSLKTELHYTQPQMNPQLFLLFA